MGWASGTELFDSMVDLALALLVDAKGSVTPEETQEVVRRVYELFEHTDWDTEDESCYFKPYLIEVMHDLGRIDDEDYEFYLDPDAFDM